MSAGMFLVALPLTTGVALPWLYSFPPRAPTAAVRLRGRDATPPAPLRAPRFDLATPATLLEYLLQPAPPPEPTVSLAVQRIIDVDTQRCLNECLVTRSDGLLCRVEEVAFNLQRVVTSRELILRWAVAKWAEQRRRQLVALLPEAVKPPDETPHTPRTADGKPLTLAMALAPMELWQLTRAAFAVSPRKVISLAWTLCVLWMSRSVLPPRVRRGRTVANALNQIAASYELVRPLSL